MAKAKCSTKRSYSKAISGCWSTNKKAFTRAVKPSTRVFELTTCWTISKKVGFDWTAHAAVPNCNVFHPPPFELVLRQVVWTTFDWRVNRYRCHQPWTVLSGVRLPPPVTSKESAFLVQIVNWSTARVRWFASTIGTKQFARMYLLIEGYIYRIALAVFS